MMSSNQRKQLMARGFLHCAVVLVLAMCGIAPATAQFPPPPPLPTPPAEAQPVPGPPKGKKAAAPPGPSIVGNWSGRLTQVGSQTPYKLSSSSAPEGQRQRILTSTARERLLASGRRNPMSSSSRSLLRARSTRVGAVPTVLSPLREPATIWRCSGLAASNPTRSSLTARSQKSSMESDELADAALSSFPQSIVGPPQTQKP